MSQFDNFWLNEIKKATRASFVGYETEKGVTRLKVVINKEPIYINLNGGFEGVTIESYAELLKQITE